MKENQNDAGQQDKKQEPAKQYHLLIDRDNIKVEKVCLTGREILVLAQKQPVERYQLNVKQKGGKVSKVGYDEQVCLDNPGIEKFLTLPLDQTEGESSRRDFALLEEDEACLDSLGLPWEAANVSGAPWVFIHHYPVPEGYNVRTATLGVRMTPGYPTAQLDMVYFHPALSRQDGQLINALTPLNLDGKAFQRWSRHRTAQNPWRSGLDGLGTHVPLADFWLMDEFRKRPGHAVPA